MNKNFILLISILTLNSCNMNNYSDLSDGLYADLETSKGNIILELYYEQAPTTVSNFVALAEGNHPAVDDQHEGKRYYDGLKFHRVIENFLVQAGDLEFGRKDNINYTYIGSGRSKYDLIKPEIDKPFEFKRGTVAFAKSKNGDAEDSEFLILLADAFLFEGEYTPLGRVINGISALEKIKFNDQSEYVLRPDFINSLKMFSDIN